MKTKRWILPLAIAGVVIIAAVIAVLVLGRYNSNGYGISVGRLYFADFGTYLIDENDSAMYVADRSKKNDLFEGYNNGDKVIVFHGGIAESYPAKTVGYAVFRIGKSDGDFNPSDESLGIYELGPDGAILTGEKVNFGVQYIRTSWNEEEDYPSVYVIHSVDELKAYYNENKDEYYLERRENPTSDLTIGFLDAIDKYDENYFKEQILIMVLVGEGSGSNRHKVNYVKKGSDGRIYTDILSVIPEIGTCDMAGWHILIEPEKGIAVEKDSDVTVLLDGIDPKRAPKPITANKNFANISLTLFDGFEYAVCDENEGESFWIDIWPLGKSDEKLKVEYSGSFALCGTGLTQKKITFGQYEAYECTYSGDKPWSFIMFEGTPGSYVIRNNGADKWWDTYGEEAMRMLSTIKVAHGIIFEEEAVSIAKANATIEYDAVNAQYDSLDGVWTVVFSKTNTSGDNQTVKITHEGKVVNTEYGE
ncbi:MAG: hypothetical protein J6V50_04960 [Clostridia bacterium]|nr:hypothetical protein [Clostridia bacterium]